MSSWQPMATAPRDGSEISARLADDQEVPVRRLFGGWFAFSESADFIRSVEPAAWRPAPACAACGVPADQARLGSAGSEHWPERRAELTCDACAERLTLAAERFRRAKGWAALEERLSFRYVVEPGHREILGREGRL